MHTINLLTSYLDHFLSYITYQVNEVMLLFGYYSTSLSNQLDAIFFFFFLSKRGNFLLRLRFTSINKKLKKIPFCCVRNITSILLPYCLLYYLFPSRGTLYKVATIIKIDINSFRMHSTNSF